MSSHWWIPIIIVGVFLVLLLVAVLGITMTFVSQLFDDDDILDDHTFIDDFPQF